MGTPNCWPPRAHINELQKRTFTVNKIYYSSHLSGEKKMKNALGVLSAAAALFATTAHAQDADEDGCEDRFSDANGACVSPSAMVDASATISADAVVLDSASIGRDMVVGIRTVIARNATLTGSSVGGTPYSTGDDSIVGRSSTIAADVSMGDNVTIGRETDVGARTTLLAGSSLGYAVTTGTDVSVGSNATVGSLASLGNYARIIGNAVVARGVVISDSDSSEAATLIAGIIGPSVSIGKNATISAGVRIRKGTNIGDNVTIESGARIGRDTVIGHNVTVRSNAHIGAASTIEDGAVVDANERIPRGTTVEPEVPTDVNSPGTTLIATSAFVDLSPPDGWTQCAGYTNTAGDDVSSEVLNGCLPFTKLRMRLYNASGVLVDDHYGSGLSVTTFNNRAYVTSGRTNIMQTNYTGSAGLYSGNPYGGTTVNPMFSTGNGGPSVIPANGTHAAEIAVGASGVTNGLIGYSVAVFN
ncbi:MAG: UDP-3-O-[3-hydroxymyristoyl] glucosamine N-acyltransferase [Myxococcota bacterium]